MRDTRKLWDGRTGSALVAERESGGEWRIYEREWGGATWIEIKEPTRLCGLVAEFLPPASTVN